MEGPKACVHMYVFIDILLPYHIKVINLKTVVTYKQIKIQQSPLKGQDISMDSRPLWLLKDSH